MDRIDVIIDIDSACEQLEKVSDMLNSLGATFSILQRVDLIVQKLEDLRTDLYSADLPNEPECEEIV